MKLLLKEDVKNLGRSGEVVSVKDGFGRNYLVPQGMAILVTPGNLKAIELEKKRLQAIQAEKIAGFRSIAEKIEALEITISALVSEGENLYGAVQAREMVEAAKEKGVDVPLEAIHVAEPVKTLGMHRIPVKLHHDVTTEFKLWVVKKEEA